MVYHRRHTTPGQSVVELGLILGLVAIAGLLILTSLGFTVQSVYCRASSALGASACQHLLNDDFANLNDWQVVNGTWTNRTGPLIGGPGEGRIFKDLSASDYIITIQANLTQGDGYGIFFRTSNPSRVNGYSFQYDFGLKAMVLRKWVNGNEITPPFAVAPAPNYPWYGQNRQIQIVVKGSTFTVLIDGKPVVSGSDSTYPSGGVGLRTWDTTSASFGGMTVDRIAP